MKWNETFVVILILVSSLISYSLLGQAADGINNDSIFETEKKFYSPEDLNRVLEEEFDGRFSAENLFNQLAGNFLLSSGYRFLNAGDLEKAQIYFQLAHDIGLEIKDEVMVGKAFNNIGYNYMQKFEFKEALGWYLKSIDILEKYNLQFELSICYRNLGEIYSSFGQHQQAVEWFRKTAEIQEQLNILQELTTSYTMIGHAYQDQGIYDDALYWYQKATGNEKKWNRKEWLAACYDNIGINYYYEGEFDQALTWQLKAKVIHESLPPALGLVISYINLGALYKTLGKPDQALSWFEKARDLAEKLNLEREMATIYNDLGSVYQDIAEYDESLEWYLRSMEIRERLNLEVDLTSSYNNIGTLKLAIGAFDEAIAWNRQAQLIQEKLALNVNLALTYNNLGRAYEGKGQPEEALTWYHRSERLGKSLGNGVDLAGVFNNLALLFYYDRQWDSSLYYVDRNLEINEQLRSINRVNTSRQLYVNRSLEVVEAGVASAFQLDKVELAFDYSERGKARSLSDLLAESSLKNYKLPPLLKAAYQSISDQLQKINKDMAQDLPKEFRKNLITKRDSLFQLRQSLNDQIKITVPEFADLIYPEIPAKDQLQAKLQNDEVLISFFTGVQNSYAFIFTSERQEMVDIGDSDSLRMLVDAYRNNFVQPQQKNLHRSNASILSSEKIKKDFFEITFSLFHTLWKPLEDTQLLTDKQIIIVPDGFLNYLPFETLIRDNQYREDWKYQYLIRSYTITYSPSATVFHLERSKDSPDKKWAIDFLGIGVQNFKNNYCAQEKGSLPDLPQSIPEVASISKSFVGSNKMLTGTAATENFLMSQDLRQYRYLHFSTHGLINTEQPDFSRILLTPSSDSDGCLHLYEIFELDLNADLISISACDAALGKLVRGEGLVGLSRALMYAGTPSLILSLWQVADTSTKDLFVQYYTSLAKDNNDKYAPLRKAKLKMIASDSEYANPFFWAPFIFIGRK